MSRVFFDTNVILYAIDLKADAKRRIAQLLLTTHQQAGEAVVSTQVLQEAYNNCLKKFGLSSGAAEDYVRELAAMHVIGSDTEFVLRSISISQRWQISVWDALIVTAASAAGCETLYTEDLNHNQRIAGVRIVNPFRQEANP